jgi:Predicted ATPases involved in biogenesis of archaeal flagella
MAATRRDIMSIGLEDHDQLNMELGGGFPPGSIVLIEGDYGAGKSAMSQRFSYGFVEEETTVTMLSTELTVSGFIEQMYSLSYDITSHLLEERLLFLEANFDSGGALSGDDDQDRKELLKRLMEAQVMWEQDVIIIDTFDAILRTTPSSSRSSATTKPAAALEIISFSAIRSLAAR